MKILFAFLLFCFVVLLMLACNTVRKNLRSEKVKTDSSHVSTNETAAVTKLDSSGTKSEHVDYQKETIYAYDTVYRVIKGDLVRVYVPRIVKVYENGTFTLRESAAKKSTDSVSSRQTDSASVLKEVAVITKEKESSRMPIGLIITGGIVFLLLAIFVVRALIK